VRAESSHCHTRASASAVKCSKPYERVTCLRWLRVSWPGETRSSFKTTVLTGGRATPFKTFKIFVLTSGDTRASKIFILTFTPRSCGLFELL
jgi:hypothetical protein